MIKNELISKIIFFILLSGSIFVSPAIALFAGIILAIVFGNPYVKAGKTISKYFLQASVVGLGFGMNLHESLAAGKEGMLLTIVSVTGVMIIGILLGKILKVEKRAAYLISSGTAICGGSAIAAVAPVIDADENETSVALATIFTLNAIALFIFPPIGRALGMTQGQFGTWAAIAIHDTSSVVGAAQEFGAEALKVATTVKLTRALWIIPLALLSAFVFKSKGKKIAIPWFILLFVVVMIANTYFPIPEILTGSIVIIAKKILCVTLFLIGCGLSLESIKKVGVKPLILGVAIWVIIASLALLVC